MNEEELMKSKKIRLLPTSEQHRYMMETVRAKDYVYNWALHFQMEYRKRNNGKILSQFKLNQIFTRYTKTKCGSWLRQYPMQSLYWAIYDLSEAFKNFFRIQKKLRISHQSLWSKKTLRKCAKQNRKPTEYEKLWHPKFKKRNKSKVAFSNGDQTCFKYNKKTGQLLGVVLLKVGTIKVKTNYDLPKGLREDQNKLIQNARITYEHGKWILSFTEEVSVKNQTKRKYSLGIDVGIRNTAVIAFGNQVMYFKNIAHSRYYKRIEKNLKHHQRNLSRKVKDSKGWKCEKKYIQRLYYKLANIRKNWIHHITCFIVKKLKPFKIGYEDLNVEGLMKNKYLAPELFKATFYLVRRQIEYKAKLNGIYLRKAWRWYPSSKICSECEHKYTKLHNQHTWICSHCHTKHNRDANAAKNLMKY